jgi:radical SAM protein with 4Fe4S-binding SPASM domain
MQISPEVKELNYSITTAFNGFSEEMMCFFNENKFMINFSFNGYLAKARAGYITEFKQMIKRMQEHVDIAKSANIVFGPGNIENILEYVKILINSGIREISLAPDIRDVWDERSFNEIELKYSDLIELFKNYQEKNDWILVSNFKKQETSLLKCSGAKDRFAINPSGKIFGCYLFNDLYNSTLNENIVNKYQLGNSRCYSLENENNYGQLKQYYFATGDKFCANCKFLQECTICPISAALVSKKIGIIPNHLCKLEQILINARRKFLAAK